jgi:hypothetical protein
MTYELTNIENQIHPEVLRSIFSDFITDFSMDNAESSKKEHAGKNLVFEISPGYFTTLQKFKRFFFDEFCRIRAAMREHKMKKTDNVFIRYVSVNYSGILRMLENTHVKKYPEGYKAMESSNLDHFQNTHALICYNLQKILLLPLKEFIEDEFCSGLLRASLMNTSSASCLQVLFSSRISLEETDFPQPGNSSENTIPEYRLLYNGFAEEADYYDYLNKSFQYFQTLLSVELQKTNENFDKIKTVIELEKIISSVKPLFHRYHSEGTDEFSPEYYRTDAICFLKRELVKNNMADCLDQYHLQLSSFTEIQRLFINRIRKILKSYLKLYQNFPSTETEYSTTANCEPSASSGPACRVKSSGKLQWRGNINQLITFFYDASNQVLINGKPILNASKNQIAKLLTENFIQKDGDPVNISTINTIFTPSKELKRPPIHKRIIFPDTE